MKSFYKAVLVNQMPLLLYAALLGFEPNCTVLLVLVVIKYPQTRRFEFWELNAG